jgi:L-fucose mutarotase
MLKGKLLHPDILQALGRAGHGSQVLLADGNYPFASKQGPNATLVSLNLSPGVVTCPQVLEALVTAIPIEAASVMQCPITGRDGQQAEPPVWNEFRRILHGAGVNITLGSIERMAFYEAARASDVVLTIATGERAVYANLLLTIGVVG